MKPLYEQVLLLVLNSALFHGKTYWLDWQMDGWCEISVLHVLLSLQDNKNLYMFLSSFTFINFRDMCEGSRNNRVQHITGDILNDGWKKK